MLKSKSEISAEVWDKVKRILESRKISQVQLKKLCQDEGFYVSQPDISKLYSGKLQLTLYQLVAFSRALNFSIDHILENKRSNGIFRLSDQYFITDPANEAFQGYMGHYYTVFYNTNPFEDRPVFGELTFTPSADNTICEAIFMLRTGERRDDGKEITKRYHGQLFISKRQSVAYVLLVNERLGEMNMIEFRHRDFFVVSLKCRLGLVLTVSSGEMKNPVSHKIFLSRMPIGDELVSKILPALKLEMDEILISKENLLEIANSNRDMDFDFSALIESGNVEEYMVINEDSLRKVDRHLSRTGIEKILSILKMESQIPYQSEIDELADSAIYKVIKNYFDQ